MKPYTFSIWLAVNLIVIATICYICFIVNFQLNATHTSRNEVTYQKITRKPVHSIPASRMNKSHIEMQEKLAFHKHQVISKLRTALLHHKKHPAQLSSPHVRLVSSRVVKDELPENLLCDLKNSLSSSLFKLLSPSNRQFKENSKFLLNSPVVNEPLHSCAIISSAGAMLNSDMGQLIGITITAHSSFGLVPVS